MVNGDEIFKLEPTGEDGVNQIRALLGIEDMVTNVNLPNYGQIPNLPIGAVVETNATFTADSVTPVFAGSIPESIYPLITRICGEQQIVLRAGIDKNLELAFQAFSIDSLVRLDLSDSRKLFDEMVKNTSAYLNGYGCI